MLKTILIYGFLLGVLVFTLHFMEYFFWVRMHIFEVYGGLIACLFLALGLWLGKKSELKTVSKSSLQINEITISNLGISKRELDVLMLMSQGHSNQQIADELFVSTNTVKTHTSRLFGKLEVKNRTQAIIKASEIGLFNLNNV